MENNTIEHYLAEIPNHYDEPDWLSKCAIQLSVLQYNLADAVAEAKYEESRYAVAYMDQIPADGGKKMSNAEAEKRATVDSLNKYDKLRLRYEVVSETVNAIKKRLDSLTQLLKLER